MAASMAYLDTVADVRLSPAAAGAVGGGLGGGLEDPTSDLLSRYRRGLAESLGLAPAPGLGLDTRGGDFVFVPTASASEANRFLIEACARSYIGNTNRGGNIITTNAEHPSVLDCCRRLREDRLCSVTVLNVVTNPADPYYGTVNPDQIKRVLRPNTCLITVSAANWETGVVTDLRPIAELAHAKKVPFHTDAALLYGRARFLPLPAGVDAFSLSLRKIGAGPGTGVLAVSQRLVDGYRLQLGAAALTGNDGRGGIPPGGAFTSLDGGAIHGGAIAAATAAVAAAAAALPRTTADSARLARAVREAVAQRLRCFAIQDWGSAESARARARAARRARRGEAADPVLYWIRAPQQLDSVLLFAVYRPGFCSRAARAALAARGVAVGNCRRPSGEMATAGVLGLPPQLRPGLLRVAVGAHTTVDEIKRFCVQFLAGLATGEFQSRAAPDPERGPGEPDGDDPDDDAVSTAGSARSRSSAGSARSHRSTRSHLSALSTRSIRSIKDRGPQ